MGESGRKAEERLPRLRGFWPTPASGALPGRKGDFESAEQLMELKTTATASYRLRLATLLKLAREAREAGKAPALRLAFVDEEGRAAENGDWVAMRARDWEELLMRAELSGIR